MKKICIIVPYDYPVPACYGGAVEFLMQVLIDENEKCGKFRFEVLSTYGSKIEELNLGTYCYTTFVYFSKSKYDKIFNYIARGFSKCFKIYFPIYPRIYSLLYYIKKHRNEYDYVLFENGSNLILPLLAKVYPKNQILCHLHWNGKGANKIIDDSFKYFLPVSEFCARRWQDMTGRLDDVYIWKNCYDDHAFSKHLTDEEKVNLKRELGITEDEKVVIFVGRILPLKGIKQLIQALNLLGDEKNHLLIIGGAKFGMGDVTPFEKEIDQNLQDSVFRYSKLGFISNSELYRYYAISDIAVMPSLYEEAASLVNIEVLATGTPLITTNSGSNREYVGDAALLVNTDSSFVENLAESIHTMLTDPILQQEYSQRGKRRSQYFTRAQYFSQFSQIIETFLETEHNETE